MTKSKSFFLFLPKGHVQEKLVNKCGKITIKDDIMASINKLINTFPAQGPAFEQEGS